MKFLIGTAHFFAPTYRDAGMHRFAKALAAMEHHVDFVTMGQSRLKQAMKPETRAFAMAANAAAEAGTNPSNIHAHLHRELVHPPSGSPRMERLTAPLHFLYGRQPDPVLIQAARAADVVILEAGYATYWFEAIRKLNPNALYLAFYNDRLDLVGFRSELRALIDRKLPKFDLVRTNAERLLDFLPPGVNGRYVPQGVDKQRIRFDSPSPYPARRRAIVSVGNMLFDEAAVREIAMATASLNTDVHVIGAAMADPPANVIVHGELPFERTLPFIVHADVGLAPYREVEGADYLAQSSLKIQQYSYCGLPVLIARGMAMRAPNFVLYTPGANGDVPSAVAQALAMPKSPAYGAEIMGWDEVGDLLIEIIQELRELKTPTLT